MKPVRTPDTNFIYHGPEPDIEDLPGERTDNQFFSEWELTVAERLAIMRGARIELGIQAQPIPPVSLRVIDRMDGDVRHIEGNGPFRRVQPGDLSRAELTTHAAALGLRLVDGEEPRRRRLAATHWPWKR